MNILYIDKLGLQTQIRISNLEELSSHTVQHAQNFSDIHLMYEANKFELVVIDHAIENGIEFVEYIHKLDKNQKVLSVSGAGFCMHQSCDDCVQNYNARRLNNPTTLKNFMRMCNDFSKYNCDHYKKS